MFNRPSPARWNRARTVAATLALTLAPGAAFATSVTIQTTLGPIVVDLFEEETPQTVANFLNYVNDDAYANSFVHRSVPGFVIQGGGFTFVDGQAVSIPTDPPVPNEPGISNARGTIAMAKLSGQPDSATSQWFINLKDNSAELDGQNGGFTVFGEVTSGMDVVDEIAALPVWNAGSPFGELPLIDYPGSGEAKVEHFVMTEVSVNSDFNINAGLNDAWYDPATAGQGFLIVVYPDIDLMFLAWFTFDTERPDESVTAQLGEPGHRWLTAQGNFSGNRAVLDVYVSEGGVFDSSEPAAVNRKDGSLVVEFSDCEAGTVRYDIPSIGRQGEIAIQRVAPDNVALCEALAAQAQ